MLDVEEDHAVQGRPKDVFRRLDRLTADAFEALEGPPVLARVAERLLADGFGLRTARSWLARSPSPACRVEGRAAELRVRAFGRCYGVTLEAESIGSGGPSDEQLELLAQTLGSILAMRVLERSFSDTMRQAAEIQSSLLPRRPPELDGFDIAVRCTPTEDVGGDLYDFLALDEETLGLAVGDASGHGLPAALLVRDVVVGLRMGMEGDLRAGHTLRKLNRVIHGSALSSCFVSLFYAELERNGNLFYFNAGHEPPMLFSADGERPLATAGTVIGPLPDARLKRHLAHVDHGSTLVVYTDGIVERRGPGGEFFGLEGLTRAVREQPGASASETVERVFERSEAFHPGQPWDDDATILVVRRLGRRG